MDRSTVDSTTLRRDNVAVLVEKRDIWITNHNVHPIRPPSFTDENWNILAEVIGTTSSLEKLVFIGENAATAMQNDKVVDALAENRTIKTLHLQDAYGSVTRGNRGVIALAAILKENTMIDEVRLIYNDIGVKGAKAIADALTYNKTLRHFDLNYNKFGKEGAKAIAQALKDNKTLHYIGLGCNQIDSVGATAIADALKKNTSLQTIDLNYNSIDNEGAKVIADALKENHSLQELSIEQNKIGEEGGKDILNALQQIERSAIENINLWGNQISEKTRTKIYQEMARIQNRFKNVGSNEGQVASVATTAGESQGVQNKRSSNEDEGMPTIHATNASQRSAENVQETNGIDDENEQATFGTASAPSFSFANPSFSFQADPSAAAPSNTHVSNTFGSDGKPAGAFGSSFGSTSALGGPASLSTPANEKRSFGSGISAPAFGSSSASTAMEPEVEHVKSNDSIPNLAIASMKAASKKVGNMVSGRRTTSNTSNKSIPDRETELLSEIERYKQEIDSLKEQLKNSKSIKAAGLTNEVETAKISEDESGGEEASSKRQRTESAHRNDNGPRSTRNSTRQVQVKQENIKKGAVKCPDPDCGSIVLLSEKGCNRVVCTKHTPHFLYFCAHCKARGEPYSETLGCDCPKRNTPADRERAQEMRNKRARENPEVLE